MKHFIPSFYSELCHRAGYFTDIVLPSPEQLMKQYKFNPDLSSAIQTVLYVVDYVKLKYLLISPPNNALGYSIDYLRDAGPLFYVGRWHSDDCRVLNQYILPTNLNFSKQHPDNKQCSSIFTFNYRIKTKRGDYLNVMQKSIYAAIAPDSTPLCAIGFVTNISPYVTNNKITQIIETFNPQTDYSPKPVLKSFFFPKEEDSVLSCREKEVLQWACEGLSSKQIADKLNISVNTISNHRRNMLEKTNCKNTSELLNYSIRQGIL